MQSIGETMRLYVSAGGGIEAEALRAEALARLSRLRETATYLTGEAHRAFWDRLHRTVGAVTDRSEKQAYSDIEAQLQTLPTFIDTWVKTAVETKERWEFFVMMKAQEIGSGNLDSDYYWALSIRHDQIVGLVRVVSKLTDLLSEWVKLKPTVLMEDPVFWGLSEYSVEKQIYLEAQKVNRERERTS